MIVWGGTGTGVNSGGKYNPSTDTWQPTSTGTGCPSGRLIHSAVWTGEKMIVWGGSPWTDTGGIYEPVVDTWEATSTGTSVPVARADHVAIWTGNEMIVWGGETGSGGVATDTGGHYDPITDTWTSTATLNAPSARYRPTAAWTGSEMIVWGGKTGAGGSSVYLDDGKKYRCVP
jgi:N-acetylneuraminic acid mutarotase